MVRGDFVINVVVAWKVFMDIVGIRITVQGIFIINFNFHLPSFDVDIIIKGIIIGGVAPLLTILIFIISFRVIFTGVIRIKV